MRQIINSASEKLYASIVLYGDTTEFVNKKADLADALGFVASHVRWGDDRWSLIGELLAEYQDVIDAWHDSARGTSACGGTSGTGNGTSGTGTRF